MVAYVEKVVRGKGLKQKSGWRFSVKRLRCLSVSEHTEDTTCTIIAPCLSGSLAYGSLMSLSSAVR